MAGPIGALDVGVASQVAVVGQHTSHTGMGHARPGVRDAVDLSERLACLAAAVTCPRGETRLLVLAVLM